MYIVNKNSGVYSCIYIDTIGIITLSYGLVVVSIPYEKVIILEIVKRINVGRILVTKRFT